MSAGGSATTGFGSGAHATAAEIPVAKTERLFDGATILSQRRIAWAGMRGELITLNRERVVEIELLTGSHALFMGVEGAPHQTTVDAEGLPKWHGVKGAGQSAFFAAGRRMRSWHSQGLGTTLILMFDEHEAEQLLHRDKPIAWRSRPSADDPFIAANAMELAAALRDRQDDLSALRAETLATSLHIYSVSRFSDAAEARSRSLDGVERAIELIHAQLPRAVTLADLASASGLPRAHLLAAFRSKTNLTPHQYIIRERLNRAKFLVSTTKHSISEVALAVGCANAEHLGQMFRQHLDMSPRAWRHLHVRRRS